MKYLIPLLCFFIFASGVEANTVILKTNIKSKLIKEPARRVESTPTPSKPKVEEQEKRISSSLPQGSVEKKIRALFGKDADLAIAIAKAESGMRCEAVGDGHIAYMQDGIEYGKSYGVFQIRHLPGRPAPSYLADCDQNIEYAYGMFKAQGHFNAWSAYTNGSYQKFIK